MLESYGYVTADLMGKIRSKAGRNSVNVDKGVEYTDNVSRHRSTDMLAIVYSSESPKIRATE